MPLPITQNTDYVGEFQITQDKFSTKKLNTYINRYELTYLNRLLGCELAKLFIADLNPSGVPTDQRFIDIYDIFCKMIACELEESAGIKEMLLGFIYFEYVKNNNSFVGTSGNKSSETENSNEAGSLVHNVYARYNLSIETYSAIQAYICDNMTVYPEFEGVKLFFNHWAL